MKEFDWWEDADLGGVTFSFVPSSHFSGRGLFDRSKTLWGSWVINGKAKSIFFSGDTGYSPFFKEIGKRFGGFDVSLMECGAYNKAWADVHMFPEQSVQAHIDLNAEKMIPIHWSKFNLAPHDWDEPIARVNIAENDMKIDIRTPVVGQIINISDNIEK